MLGQLSDKQCDRLLHSQHTGRIGCHAQGKTYVVPVTYLYEDGYIICHSREGMKLDMMRSNPEVCFEVDDVQDMANWQSVIAWGRFEELHEEEARAAMNKLISHFLPMKTSETAHPVDPGHTQERRQTKGFSAVIYRIRISEKTGRFEKS